MSRQELENELMAHHWGKRYHGTECDVWQSGEAIITLTDKGVGGVVGGNFIPYGSISVRDGKMIIHEEIRL